MVALYAPAGENGQYYDFTHALSQTLVVPTDSFINTVKVDTTAAQWLRYCTTNQKVVGSISDGVMEFFIDINPSDGTMALGSTQPLTEMSTRSISWG
jgi:hypothetical protein